MINTYKLSNGITVVTEPLNHFESTAIGVWVKTGSAYENETENGISHLIEHMLFKGTTKRNAKQIAVEIDRIGGQINAFTSKECTCYYSRVVNDKIETAVDVLSDLLKDALIDSKELDKERLVVLEEISMINDQPDDLAHEQISKDFFNGTVFSKPVIGTSDNIRRFSRDDIMTYMAQHYYPENIVISVAGKFEASALKSLLEQYFGNYTRQSFVGEATTDAIGFQPKRTISFIRRDIEQAHISLGFNGIAYRDDRRFTYMIFSNLFGGSMSSRLFQKVREDMGLVYSVYSYLSTYTSTGMLGIYAATGAKTAALALDTIQQEIDRLILNGVDEEEFLNSKTQMTGNYMLGLESVSARMQSIGKSQALLGYVHTQEEIMDMLTAVTLDDVNHVIKDIFDYTHMNAAFVGKIKNESELKKICK